MKKKKEARMQKEITDIFYTCLQKWSFYLFLGLIFFQNFFRFFLAFFFRIEKGREKKMNKKKRKTYVIYVAEPKKENKMKKK